VALACQAGQWPTDGGLVGGVVTGGWVTGGCVTGGWVTGGVVPASETRADSEAVVGFQSELL